MFAVHAFASGTCTCIQCLRCVACLGLLLTDVCGRDQQSTPPTVPGYLHMHPLLLLLLIRKSGNRLQRCTSFSNCSCDCCLRTTQQAAAAGCSHSDITEEAAGPKHGYMWLLSHAVCEVRHGKLNQRKYANCCGGHVLSKSRSAAANSTQHTTPAAAGKGSFDSLQRGLSFGMWL